MNLSTRTLAISSLISLCSACASIEEATGDRRESEWTERPHHISFLFGGTVDDEEEAATIGVDYEYRVSEFLGLGGVAEYAFDDIDATTLLAVADLHLTNQFIVQTGPGIEFIDDEEEFVFRLGVLYEWELEGYTFSPQLHYDATSGEDAVVFAVAVGYGF